VTISNGKHATNRSNSIPASAVQRGMAARTAPARFQPRAHVCSSLPGSPPARMRRLGQQRGHVKWCGPRSPTSSACRRHSTIAASRTIGSICEAGERLRQITELQQAVKDVRQETRNLIVMQMRPGQSPERLNFLRDMERSCRAETKLRLRALAHLKATTYLNDEGGSIT
jgi:hypothetical protein